MTSITLFFPASQGAENIRIYYVGFLGQWTEVNLFSFVRQSTRLIILSNSGSLNRLSLYTSRGQILLIIKESLVLTEPSGLLILLMTLKEGLHRSASGYMACPSHGHTSPLLVCNAFKFEDDVPSLVTRIYSVRYIL